MIINSILTDELMNTYNLGVGQKGKDKIIKFRLMDREEIIKYKNKARMLGIGINDDEEYIVSSYDNVIEIISEEFIIGEDENRLGLFFSWEVKELNLSNIRVDKNGLKVALSCNINRLDFGNIDLSLVDDMEFLIDNCKINEINMEDVIVPLQSVSISEAFIYSDIGELKLPYMKVKEAKKTFNSSQFINGIDLSKLDFSETRIMQGIFISGLFGDIKFGDINTENLRDASSMFELAVVNSTINISQFKFGRLTNMKGMFSSCSVNEIIFGRHKMPNLRNMEDSFAWVHLTKKLDLSGVTCLSDEVDISGMFYGSIFEDGLELWRSGIKQVCNKAFTQVEVSRLLKVNVVNRDITFDKSIINSLEIRGLKGLEVDGKSIFSNSTIGTLSVEVPTNCEITDKQSKFIIDKIEVLNNTILTTEQKRSIATLELISKRKRNGEKIIN